MADYVLRTPDTAEWHVLVNEAEVVADCCLEGEVEQYLVSLLLRYVGRPGIVQNPLPVGVLASGKIPAGPGGEQLRDMADQCLIVAGLYPEQAGRHQIPLSRLVEVGQEAYSQLASAADNALFEEMSHNFVVLMDILQTMRELDDGRRCLDPLSAFQLWSDTGSRYAWRVLRSATDCFPAPRAPLRVH